MGHLVNPIGLIRLDRNAPVKWAHFITQKIVQFIIKIYKSKFPIPLHKTFFLKYGSL